MPDIERTETLVLDPEEPSKTPYLITAVALAVVAAGSAAAYIYMKKKWTSKTHQSNWSFERRKPKL